MILAVRCNQPSFKTVKFEPGLNIVLAERTKEATKKDSRNGLGKTTLIEIIHFCLGADIKKENGLGAKELQDWVFTLDITLHDKPCSISRNTAEPSKVEINGDFSDWPVKPELDKKTGRNFLSTRDLTGVLGNLIFDLQRDYPGYKYKPKFRSLISYFVRRVNEGGFMEAFTNHRSQQEWDKQLHNAYLLGLNWEHASEWQKLKDKEKVLRELQKAATEGLLSNFFDGSMGELEARKVRISKEIDETAKDLKTFRVHAQYHDIERQANDLTEQIHSLANQSVLDKQLLGRYKASIQQEQEPPTDDIKKVYEKVGVVFPDVVQKRFEEVLSFHRSVITNRREFLSSEIERLEMDIKKREDATKSLGGKRAELMSILSTHGALDEYTKIQLKHNEVVSQLKVIENRIENYRAFEEGKSTSKIDKEKLLLRARVDLTERKDQKEEAILLFHENSKALYESPGTLVIEAGDTGFKYSVEIERSRSQGIGHMKIFCYDLMLVKKWSKKPDMPGFLIHDSTIFEGVDERQIARAIELAASDSKKHKFQYICTMNSDTLPLHDFSKDFDWKQYVRVQFTDAANEGGLLGVRF